jgi:hypothetical protein
MMASFLNNLFYITGLIGWFFIMILVLAWLSHCSERKNIQRIRKSMEDKEIKLGRVK